MSAAQVNRAERRPALPRLGLARLGGHGQASAALVFLVALNLRPALTGVGPLLPELGTGAGLGEGAQGLLGALPLLAFGLVSPLVHRLSRRLGMERAVLAALLALVVGVVVRSYTGLPGLWLGTVLAGCAVAVGNVLVPTIVKRDYAGHISAATGAYSACITVGASAASALAVPMSSATGWRAALAWWAVPALSVAVVWSWRALAARPPAHPSLLHDRAPSMVWREPTAWLLTAFMGLQSTTFYVMVTWLPTIEASAGTGARQAGLGLFAYQLVGAASGLAVTRLMRRPEDLVVATVAASVPMLAGVLGLLVAPALSLVWAVVAGLGSGASLVVALSMVNIHGRTHQETAQLSGMAQSLGYLLAATGPVVAGYLAQQTGSWAPALMFMAGLAAAQLLVAFPAGRARGLQGAS